MNPADIHREGPTEDIEEHCMPEPEPQVGSGVERIVKMGREAMTLTCPICGAKAKEHNSTVFQPRLTCPKGHISVTGDTIEQARERWARLMRATRPANPTAGAATKTRPAKGAR